MPRPSICNGGDSGIDHGPGHHHHLDSPIVYGISLNFAEIGQIKRLPRPTARARTSSVAAYTYGTTDMTIADVQPTTGRLCAGTWNRNSGGGIPDYTYCTPTNKSGIAYVSASSNGVTSNPLPVFVHPVVTSIVLGGPSSNCTTDPTTACCPLATSARSPRRPIWQTPASRRDRPPSLWRGSTPAPAPTRPTSVAWPGICSSPRRAPRRRPQSRPSSASTRTAWPRPINRDRC